MPLGPLGFVPRDAGGGKATWEYTVDPAHYNTNGVLHGGVLMALLDTAMGHAVAVALAGRAASTPPRSSTSTSSVPIKSGLVRARAEVKKIGKRLAVVEAEATDEGAAWSASRRRRTGCCPEGRSASGDEATGDRRCRIWFDAVGAGTHHPDRLAKSDPVACCLSPVARVFAALLCLRLRPALPSTSAARALAGSFVMMPSTPIAAGAHRARSSTVQTLTA